MSLADPLILQSEIAFGLTSLLDLIMVIVIVVFFTKLVLRYAFGVGVLKAGGRGGAGFLGHLFSELILMSFRATGRLVGWMLRTIFAPIFKGAGRAIDRSTQRLASLAAVRAVSDGSAVKTEKVPLRVAHVRAAPPAPIVITRRRPDGGTEEVWRSH
jgi:hypothetical protein